MRVVATLLWAALLWAAGVSALDNGVGLTPPLAWSSWNALRGNISSAVLREMARALVSTGLRDAGFRLLNVDDGWVGGREPDGTPIADPALFPEGMAAFSAYIQSLGLQLGLYTAWGNRTCLGRLGSLGFEKQDAAAYAKWGVSFLKVDTCGGTPPTDDYAGLMWDTVARIRDALNATGSRIVFSVTARGNFSDGHARMRCYGEGEGLFSPFLFGPHRDPTTLANSMLVEYCNNQDRFGFTDGFPQPGGFLSNLDAQQLLAPPNMSGPGFFLDADLLYVCNGGQTITEGRAQFSLWAILASQLMLGNDVRNVSTECLSILGNKEVIAVNQDALGLRGRLALQWPTAVWPPNDPPLPPKLASRHRHPLHALAPPALAALTLKVCNASDPAQLFSLDPATAALRSDTPQFGATCLTFGGFEPTNIFATACSDWHLPGIGSQRWAPDPANSTMGVEGCGGRLAVLDCNVNSPHLRVCGVWGPWGGGIADCYSGPPSTWCGASGQQWAPLPTSGAPPAPITTLAQAQTLPSHCLSLTSLPRSPIDIRTQLWVKPMVDGSLALLVFNRDATPHAFNVTWAALGLNATTQLRLRDLHAHADLPGVYAAWVELQVPPHDVVFLRGWPL